MPETMNKPQKDPVNPKHIDGHPAQDWVILRRATNNHRQEQSRTYPTLTGLAMTTAGLVIGISALWALGLISSPLDSYTNPSTNVSNTHVKSPTPFS